MEGIITLSVPSSIPRKRTAGLLEKTFFLQGQVIKFPISKRNQNQNVTKLKFLKIRPQASGTTNSGSQEAIQKNIIKDESVAFVAGATGRVGSRAVRELLKLGFQVRAGVRSAEKAQSLVQSVKQMSAVGETQPVEKLEIVQCDLEKKDLIGPALGKVSVVLCCIGASEKEIFDISGPYRIDYAATKNLIEAATVAKVEHFILLTSLGTNKVGFPAAILNLFWGVLIWKRKAEEALLASGLPYTIVRPGGMERPTDTFKETHNITLSKEDTLFGGLVSNLQVAELMACMAKSRDLSCCKVVEVVAETTAPLVPMEELLKAIPSQRPCSFTPKRKDQESVPENVADDEKAEESATRPLSPYAVYEDLKPPSSPSPTPSIITLTTSTPTPSQKPKRSDTLSPYTAYEDLKPPSSPSPTPSGVRKQPPDSADLVDGVSENGPPQTNPVNDNLNHTPDETAVEEIHAKPKPRPLSPYSMYEDLKPPSSPSPSKPF